MAFTLRDVVAHLFGSDSAAPVEPADHLVALTPARPPRRGIPDEYLELYPDGGILTSGRDAAIRTSPAASSLPPRDPVRAPLPTLLSVLASSASGTLGPPTDTAR